jgi:hypothetical protein
LIDDPAVLLDTFVNFEVVVPSAVEDAVEATAARMAPRATRVPAMIRTLRAQVPRIGSGRCS